MKKKETIKVKAWWLRKGGEGFLCSNLWMNGQNARLAAKSFNLNQQGKHYPKTRFRVIPCTITYQLVPTK